MSHASITLSGAVAVVRVLARGEEGFPRDTRRIVDPGLLRLRIATRGLSLLDDIAACFAQTRIDFLKFALALDLDAEMIEPGCLPRVEIAKLTRGSSSIHLA
jgi:hypothetical protein